MGVRPLEVSHSRRGATGDGESSSERKGLKLLERRGQSGVRVAVFESGLDVALRPTVGGCRSGSEGGHGLVMMGGHDLPRAGVTLTLVNRLMESE